jgi:hypothetical protein
MQSQVGQVQETTVRENLIVLMHQSLFWWRSSLRWQMDQE